MSFSQIIPISLHVAVRLTHLVENTVELRDPGAQAAHSVSRSQWGRQKGGQITKPKGFI